MASRAVSAVLIAGLLSACGSGEALQYPAPDSFIATGIGLCPLACADASATQLTPTIAVTAAHAKLLASYSATDLKVADIAWYSHPGSAPHIREPKDGEPVTLYGNSAGLGLRYATGHVIAAHGFIDRGDHKDYGIVIAADIGPWGGFSGGGVYGSDGSLIGITTDMMRVTTGQYGGAAAFAYWASEIKAEIAP